MHVEAKDWSSQGERWHILEVQGLSGFVQASCVTQDAAITEEMLMSG
jgi:hypothetical protein